MTPAELQALMVGGMPPLHSARIGDWLLRAANGYTGRANSALAVGDPGMPLPEAIDRVARWYAEQNQPPLVQLTHATNADPSGSALGSLLTQRHWRFFQSTLVMTLRPEAAAPLPRVTEVRVEVATTPTDDWWAASSPRVLEHRDTLARMLTNVQDGAYLTAYIDGRVVGHARLAFNDDWSGIFDIHTDPDVRRRGVATALMSAATSAAAERRISLQYLQVSTDNDPAVQLYESLGWRVHHEYHYARPHGA